MFLDRLLCDRYRARKKSIPIPGRIYNLRGTKHKGMHESKIDGRNSLETLKILIWFLIGFQEIGAAESVRHSCYINILIVYARGLVLLNLFSYIIIISANFKVDHFNLHLYMTHGKVRNHEVIDPLSFNKLKVTYFWRGGHWIFREVMWLAQNLIALLVSWRDKTSVGVQCST